jgi:hypothetical protein
VCHHHRRWLLLQHDRRRPTTTEIEAEELASREAEYGQKTVAIVLRFYTNEIAEKPGEILPKHVADAGTVTMVQNSAHGIEPKKTFHFHSLPEILTAIEDLITEHGITVHVGHKSRSRRYMAK